MTVSCQNQLYIEVLCQVDLRNNKREGDLTDGLMIMEVSLGFFFS